MLTWQQIRDALDKVLKDDEPLFAVHVAAGKDGLEIVRDDPTKGTIVRSPAKEQEV